MTKQSAPHFTLLLSTTQENIDNALLALLYMHQRTGNPKWLKIAESLARDARCPELIKDIRNTIQQNLAVRYKD